MARHHDCLAPFAQQRFHTVFLVRGWSPRQITFCTNSLKYRYVQLLGLFAEPATAGWVYEQTTRVSDLDQAVLQ